MKITACAVALALAVGSVVVGAASSESDIQADASAQILKWQTQAQHNIVKTIKSRSSGCTLQRLAYRQEWGTLSPRARRDYIDAVHCLRQKPARSDKTAVPGARSRYDDWLATHIINTLKVHFSGLFFQYHRHATWTYEQALREECGYRGTQPYWDWTLNYNDLGHSTVFDGSPTSMGSNGKFIPRGDITLAAFGFNITFPAGTGGGCIESGPFANVTVNLGPLDNLDYNPRCVERDFMTYFSNYIRPSSVVDLIKGCGDDFPCFSDLLQTLYGVHTAGHLTIGGLQRDVYTSPGDPAWYLHHSQIDRVWTIWQDLHPEYRTYQVHGTSSAGNVPPTPNVTLDSMVDFQAIDASRSLRYLASTIDGPYCYAYK
ncbi:MAG: hypothetical protein Q9220_006208 [cf. Caloplaca sp. 1 TL-2023]